MTGTPTEHDDEGAWAKLRRRKVVQWGLAYAAGAWVLLQALGLAADTFEWPHLIRQLVFIGLAVGLPIALVLAWYHGDRGQQRVSGTELLILSVMLAVGGGVLWLYGQRNDRAPVSSIPPATSPAAPTAAQATSSASADSRPSIAVLPFENRSDQQKDAFFVDGIHDDILTQLSKVSALKVISRTSVEQFRDTKLPTKAIAEQLGVKSILEGGVQRAGDRVRINVQLINAQTDEHLWAESYDRELTAANIFAIQSEVAAAIAGALKAALTAGEKARVEAVPTQSLEAWENYQLGRQRIAKRTSAGLSEGEQYFRKAIELDPKFALAYSGLADALTLSVAYSGAPPIVTYERAQAAADTALKLDPGLADAWASAAFVAYNRENYDRAEELYRRAIELSPNHAMALKFYGNLLQTIGRTDEAVRFLERAAALDPLSAIIQDNLGNALEARGQFDAAAARYRRAVEIDPLMPGNFQDLALLAAYAMGNFVTAVPLSRRAADLDPDNPVDAFILHILLWNLGDDQAAERTLQQAERRWPDQTNVQTALALRALMRRDSSGAVWQAARASDSYPRNGLALAILNTIDLQQKRPAESVARVRKAYPELFSATPRIDASNYYVALLVVPALQQLGRTDESLALLDGSEKAMSRVPLLGTSGRAPFDAVALALRGRKQEAISALRAAEQAGWRSFWRVIRDVDPPFDSIRDEPEFKAIFADIERDMARQRAELAKRPKDAPLDLDVH